MKYNFECFLEHDTLFKMGYWKAIRNPDIHNPNWDPEAVLISARKSSTYYWIILLHYDMIYNAGRTFDGWKLREKVVGLEYDYIRQAFNDYLY